MFELQSEQTDKIDAALAKAQGEIKIAVKNKKNPHFKSDYADLAAYVEASREALAKHGISVSQPVMPTESGLFLVTQLRCGGQWLRSYYPLSFGNNPQANGSAMTYARRFALAAMLGIAPDDPDMADDDGNAATEEARRNPPRQQQRQPPAKQEESPPSDPRAIKQDGITLHWPDGKTREFPRTVVGAKEFVKSARSAIATNPAVYEIPANKEWLDDIKEKIPALADEIAEIEDLYANPPAAALAAAE